MKQQENQIVQKMKSSIRVYENFPKPGVSFMDIFCILSQPELLKNLIDIFAKSLQNVEYDKIYMLQSRGFLFAVPLSMKVNKPCFPFRKKGKLPGEVVGTKYSLEYGGDEIQIQKQYIKPGDKVIIVDDVLATGGTLNAAIKLIQQQGAIVEKVLLINIIQELKGLDKLTIPKQKVFYLYDV